MKTDDGGFCVHLVAKNSRKYKRGKIPSFPSANDQ
jgi:hypothetical protein